MRALGYVRVSSDEQVRLGVSLDSQRATIQDYCRLKRMELVEIVADEGVSAGKDLATRVGGKRIAEFASKGKVDAVVTCKLDRLFRDAADCLALTKVWDKQRVSLHLIDVGGESIDTSSPTGRLFLTMLVAFAELERAMIRERTRSAMRYKKSQGKRVGEIPFGFSLDQDGVNLVQVDCEQSVIATIRDLRGRGLSLRAIASEISKMGLPSKKGQAIWNHNSIARILNRETAS